MRALANDGRDGIGALLLVLFIAVASASVRWQIGQLDEACSRRADQLAQFDVLVAGGVPAGSAGDAALEMLDGLFPGERLVCVGIHGRVHLDLRAGDQAGVRP